MGAERIAKSLRDDGYKTEALHGDLRQGRRDTVMRNLRKQKFRILVATDIASRGLDVPHVEHVINYDLPQVAEDYIHRLGRTARAGADGAAVCFVCDREKKEWYAIQKLLDPEFKAPKAANSDKKPKRRRRYSNGKKKRSFDKPRNKARRSEG